MRQYTPIMGKDALWKTDLSLCHTVSAAKTDSESVRKASISVEIKKTNPKSFLPVSAVIKSHNMHMYMQLSIISDISDHTVGKNLHV